MKILGIETSCDETAVAIVKNGTKILSNVVASSLELHQKTGGIIPEIAAREQVKCIIPVINETMKDIDAIAVTYGPGLIGSLLVGIETAKALTYLWQKPIVPVNHLLAHIYGCFLQPKLKSQKSKVKSDKTKNSLPKFPAVCLIASGGHTELVLMKNHGNFTWLGGTRDDAAGEAFDKIARLLGLGFPGGPMIERYALKFKVQGSRFEVNFPRPMISENNLDFSFSGLKTAVLKKIKELKETKQLNNQTTEQLAFEVQEAITDCLVTKTIRATRKFKAKSILLAGGVAANQRLREKMKQHATRNTQHAKFFAPAKNLSTDNAAPIASYAFFNYRPVPWQKITPYPSLEIDEQPF